MQGKRLWLVCWLVACAVFASGQARRDVRFENVFENPQVAVFTLELPEHGRAAVYQGTHDVIWLALNDAGVNFVRRDRSVPAVLAAGDVRFFPAFQLTAVSNDKGATARGVLIELKTRGLVSSGCDCGTVTERTVCGCAGASHLPDLWALALGQVTLGGTTLKAGDGFQGSSFREAMLLVAISDLNLRDAAAAEGNDAGIRLAPGQAQWIPAGAHQLRNLGTATAKFLTVEF
jgi:hypothetical protein